MVWMKQTNIKRGDIFWVDFDPSTGTETRKKRPALICSHDDMNENSNRVIVAPITLNLKKVFAFEYKIEGHSFVKGKAMFDQIKAVDKTRIGTKIGSILLREMNEVDTIIKFVLGLK
jgi:mRNA interferase MazF